MEYIDDCNLQQFIEHQEEEYNSQLSLRKCKKCGTIKNGERCKPCSTKYQAEYRLKNKQVINKAIALCKEKNPEKYRNIYKKLAEKNKEKVKASMDKWLIKNKKQRFANVTLCNAVRDGRIEKPSNCSMCGVIDEKLHGHHDDYNKPLDVRWVCVKCHHEIHKSLKLIRPIITGEKDDRSKDSKCVR